MLCESCRIPCIVATFRKQIWSKAKIKYLRLVEEITRENEVLTLWMSSPSKYLIGSNNSRLSNMNIFGSLIQ